MTEKSEVRIFLAHASEDKEQVRDLYRRLQKEGYCPWLDEEDLLPGQLWREEIQKAIKNSDFFIACLSEQSVAKQGYVQREFRLALNYCAERPTGNIYLIPLKLNECNIPDLRQDEYGIFLRNYQWLNYYDPDGFKRLIQAIEFQKRKMRTETSDIKEANLNEVVTLPDSSKVISTPHDSKLVDAYIKIWRVSHPVTDSNASYDIYLDAQRVGSLYGDGSREIKVLPGKHVLQIKTGSAQSVGSKELTIDISEGEMVYLECGSNVGLNLAKYFWSALVVRNSYLYLKRRFL